MGENPRNSRKRRAENDEVADQTEEETERSVPPKRLHPMERITSKFKDCEVMNSILVFNKKFRKHGTITDKQYEDFKNDAEQCAGNIRNTCIDLLNAMKNKNGNRPLFNSLLGKRCVHVAEYLVYSKIDKIRKKAYFIAKIKNSEPPYKFEKKLRFFRSCKEYLDYRIANQMTLPDVKEHALLLEKWNAHNGMKEQTEKDTENDVKNFFNYDNLQDFSDESGDEAEDIIPDNDDVPIEDADPEHNPMEPMEREEYIMPVAPPSPALLMIEQNAAPAPLAVRNDEEDALIVYGPDNHAILADPSDSSSHDDNSVTASGKDEHLAKGAAAFESTSASSLGSPSAVKQPQSVKGIGESKENGSKGLHLLRITTPELTQNNGTPSRSPSASSTRRSSSSDIEQEPIGNGALGTTGPATIPAVPPSPTLLMNAQNAAPSPSAVRNAEEDAPIVSGPDNLAILSGSSHEEKAVSTNGKHERLDKRSAAFKSSSAASLGSASVVKQPQSVRGIGDSGDNNSKGPTSLGVTTSELTQHNETPFRSPSASHTQRSLSPDIGQEPMENGERGTNGPATTPASLASPTLSANEQDVDQTAPAHRLAEEDAPVVSGPNSLALLMNSSSDSTFDENKTALNKMMAEGLDEKTTTVETTSLTSIGTSSTVKLPHSPEAIENSEGNESNGSNSFEIDSPEFIQYIGTPSRSPSTSSTQRSLSPYIGQGLMGNDEIRTITLADFGLNHLATLSNSSDLTSHTDKIASGMSESPDERASTLTTSYVASFNSGLAVKLSETTEDFKSNYTSGQDVFNHGLTDIRRYAQTPSLTPLSSLIGQSLSLIIDYDPLQNWGITATAPTTLSAVPQSLPGKPDLLSNVKKAIQNDGTAKHLVKKSATSNVSSVASLSLTPTVKQPQSIEAKKHVYSYQARPLIDSPGLSASMFLFSPIVEHFLQSLSNRGPISPGVPEVAKSNSVLDDKVVDTDESPAALNASSVSPLDSAFYRRLSETVEDSNNKNTNGKNVLNSGSPDTRKYAQTSPLSSSALTTPNSPLSFIGQEPMDDKEIKTVVPPKLPTGVRSPSVSAEEKKTDQNALADEISKNENPVVFGSNHETPLVVSSNVLSNNDKAVENKEMVESQDKRPATPTNSSLAPSGPTLAVKQPETVPGTTDVGASVTNGLQSFSTDSPDYAQNAITSPLLSSASPISIPNLQPMRNQENVTTSTSTVPAVPQSTPLKKQNAAQDATGERIAENEAAQVVSGQNHPAKLEKASNSSSSMNLAVYINGASERLNKRPATSSLASLGSAIPVKQKKTVKTDFLDNKQNELTPPLSSSGSPTQESQSPITGKTAKADSENVTTAPATIPSVPQLSAKTSNSSSNENKTVNGNAERLNEGAPTIKTTSVVSLSLASVVEHPQSDKDIEDSEVNDSIGPNSVESGVPELKKIERPQTRLPSASDSTSSQSSSLANSTGKHLLKECSSFRPVDSSMMTPADSPPKETSGRGTSPEHDVLKDTHDESNLQQTEIGSELSPMPTNQHSNNPLLTRETDVLQCHGVQESQDGENKKDYNQTRPSVITHAKTSKFPNHEDTVATPGCASPPEKQSEKVVANTVNREHESALTNLKQETSPKVASDTGLPKVAPSSLHDDKMSAFKPFKKPLTGTLLVNASSTMNQTMGEAQHETDPAAALDVDSVGARMVRHSSNTGVRPNRETDQARPGQQVSDLPSAFKPYRKSTAESSSTDFSSPIAQPRKNISNVRERLDRTVFPLGGTSVTQERPINSTAHNYAFEDSIHRPYIGGGRFTFTIGAPPVHPESVVPPREAIVGSSTPLEAGVNNMSPNHIAAQQTQSIQAQHSNNEIPSYITRPTPIHPHQVSRTDLQQHHPVVLSENFKSPIDNNIEDHWMLYAFGDLHPF